MTERPLHPIAAAFRSEALAILERRGLKTERLPIRKGHILIQPLSRGYRLDVVGQDDNGKPLRLATSHFHRLDSARITARSLGATMGVIVRDMTRDRGAE